MSTQPLLQRTSNKKIALPVRVEPKVSVTFCSTVVLISHFNNI